jgi:hypothetical protein
VCFACGQPQLEISAGDMTVFVTGPGNVAEKLDATLRQKLLAWIKANPALGIVPRHLVKEVPRLPFALLVGIDEPSATALVAELAKLGLLVCSQRGGRLSLAQMREKGWALTKRIAVIGSTGWFFAARNSAPVLVIGAVIVGFTSLWRGFGTGTRPVAHVSAKKVALLPSSLDAALTRVAAIVPAMAAARHRDTLRGVVDRALSLRDVVQADDELAKLIDVAAMAASRLDQLEAELSPEDLKSDDETKRARWRQRDGWSAKLLQVTAFLDAMRARAVMAKARTAAQGDLDQLRAHVEALEEVSA